MKTRFFSTTALLLFLTISLHAQRGLQIGYIDMEYILENVPEYQEASNQLEAKVQQWKSELELKRKAIDEMKQNLENERPLLTKELIEERLGEIQFEEEQLLALQQQHFGPAGDMITMKRQLIKPVQDQIFSAVQEIGETRKYDFIFENSSDALLLFSAKRHDISDRVLMMIKRSSRENARNKSEEEMEEEPYKSVLQAEDDKKEAAEHQAEMDRRERERQEKLNARERERDSLQAIREAEFNAKREALLEQREARKRKRDSLNAIREEKRNGN